MKPERRKVLLVDVGNTNTDFALSDGRSIGKVASVATDKLRRIPFVTGSYQSVVLASVVPAAVTKRLIRLLDVEPLLVNAEIDLGIGVRYPNRKQIGADRLANAVGVAKLYGAPAIVVDFGTAVTFDILSPREEYIGGVIAPGLSAMTDYLYEHTALLPHIELREPKSMVGKSTVDAMMVGAVVGYRGLVKEILTALRGTAGMRRATVVATGGYGGLIARKIPEIRQVNPMLTLEGLRFIYLRNSRESNRPKI